MPPRSNSAEVMSRSRSRARSSSGREALRHTAHVDLRAVFQRDGASRFVHLHGGVAHPRQQRGQLVGGGHPGGRRPRSPQALRPAGTPWGRYGAWTRLARRVERRGDERGRRRRDGRRRAACGVRPGHLAGHVLGGQQLVQFEDALSAGVCRVVSDGLAGGVHGEGHAGVHSREGAGGRLWLGTSAPSGSPPAHPTGLTASAATSAHASSAANARPVRRTTGRAGGSVLSRETLHHGITGTPVC